jgi:hypothetical protein
MIMFNRRMTLKACAACCLAVALACGAVSAYAQKKRKAAPVYTVAVNTTMRLRLNDKISSKDARVGDTFASTVVTPLYVRGVEVVPAGSTVTGHVTHVNRAGRKSQAGSINVTFTSLELPNGARRAINASLTTSASADNEGQVKGKSSTKKNVAFIGAGLVVGGLINGVAGAATGGLIGVGRGLIKKGEEAEVKPGTEFDVILNRAVTLNAYR